VKAVCGLVAVTGVRKESEVHNREKRRDPTLRSDNDRLRDGMMKHSAPGDVCMTADHFELLLAETIREVEPDGEWSTSHFEPASTEGNHEEGDIDPAPALHDCHILPRLIVNRPLYNETAAADAADAVIGLHGHQKLPPLDSGQSTVRTRLI